MIYRVLSSRPDLTAFGVIAVVVILSFVPTIASGSRFSLDGDFLQYASRHEMVRKSLLEHGTFPLRSHWFGGGYPTLGDPEDPSLNPFVLLSILFGPIVGLKLIGILSVLIGGMSTYALARYVLGYTRWGALFSGLIIATSLFVPTRMRSGNPNDACAAFLPLCLLLVGLACRGRKIAFVLLPLVFCTMLSDGKTTCFMAMFFVGVVCLLDAVPIFGTFAPRGSPSRVDLRPLKILLVALGITVLIGMARILPAVELIRGKGGLANIDLFFHPDTYNPHAGTLEDAWKALVGWEGRDLLTTIGWLPVILFVAAPFASWKRWLPWGIALALFGWLMLANNAPVDLFRLLWKLPIFNAVRWPVRSFGFEIVFAVAIASGQSFDLLRRLQPRWLEHLVAVALIGAGVAFLYPLVLATQTEVYTVGLGKEFQLVPEEKLFNVQGLYLRRNRAEPPLAVTYFNLLHNIGTVDWYTGIPIDENAVPKYFVDAANKYIPNPAYRGEVFFLRSENRAEVTFHPNSISIEASLQTPDTVVINQNYHRDWHTSHGELFNRDGLIALRLPETGSFTIHLRYHPRSFYAGLAITCLALAALLWICWAHKTGRLLEWAESGSPVFKRGSQGVLWLID